MPLCVPCKTLNMPDAMLVVGPSLKPVFHRHGIGASRPRRKAKHAQGKLTGPWQRMLWLQEDISGFTVQECHIFLVGMAKVTRAV